MSLTKSNSYANWSGVQFVYTDSAGAQQTKPLTKVESIDYNLGSTLIEFEGDNAPGPTDLKETKRKREVTLVTADEATALAIPTGVVGVLTAIREDRTNGAAAGGGGFTLTLANCCAYNPKFGGKHAEFGKFTLQFAAMWSMVGNAWVDPLTTTPL